MLTIILIILFLFIILVSCVQIEEGTFLKNVSFPFRFTLMLASMWMMLCGAAFMLMSRSKDMYYMHKTVLQDYKDSAFNQGYRKATADRFTIFYTAPHDTLYRKVKE